MQSANVHDQFMLQWRRISKHLGTHVYSDMSMLKALIETANVLDKYNVRQLLEQSDAPPRQQT